MKRSDQGTLGLIYYEGFKCYTLELPWKNNQSNVSCIPKGSYLVKSRISPKYGEVYWVSNVPDRTFILIHPGNWAGDKSKGFRSNVNGCILLGKRRGILAGQLAVLNSRITVKRFQNKLQLQPFTLNIHEEF
ncbi:MAG: DUF5675 family protein [Candidatus Thorarchaeota archaeon]